MTSKKTTGEQAPAGQSPDPSLLLQAKDAEIAELRRQIDALEAFANAVVEQRNQAQNQVAQVTGQLQNQLRLMQM